MERVILTTGGTGGHVFPALAVADELRARWPGLQVLFVGGTWGKEREYAAEAGLEFAALPVRGVLGRGLAALGALGAMGVSVVRAVGLVRNFRPQAVLGFGGYASVPAVAAAALLGVPCAVHEQNAVPGVANRLLGKLARKVLLTHPDEGECFDPDRCELTGNPVRGRILEAGAYSQPPATAPASRRVLVAGGSLGARPINEAVLRDVTSIVSHGMRVWHQTGEQDFPMALARYRALGMLDPGPGGKPPVRVAPFIADMAEAYAWADLVLCRAGATTVSELAVMGKPSALIPLPHATHNHQAVNARTLAEHGAAVVLRQDMLETTDLTDFLEAFFTIPGRLRDMAVAARYAARPEAAALIADAAEELARAARTTQSREARP
jgi:UDP-N-acetylglucosamine--N-acetylmuramyl-(pentapeptide) pyrophosphoryl-undecaprenol N-acetylglucosamine transferase